MGKLIVTGVLGRLGRAIAAEASARGWSVVGVDRVAASGEMPDNVETVLGSFEDFTLMATLMKDASHLIHTSGLHGGDVATHTLPEFIRSNVENAARLIELALEHKIRNICLSSTMEVLVGRDWSASGCSVLDEMSPLQTDSAYSISRSLQERLAGEMSRRRDISVSLLRYVAFGYCEDHELGASLLARRITARDAARAALLAVGKDDLRGEVFNIGPQSPLTNRDIVEALVDPRGVLEKYFPGASEVLDKSGLSISAEHFWPVTSIAKANRLLNWQPEFTFETWLGLHGWTR